MKFFCDQCNAQYMIADEKVGPKGVKVKCKKCSNLITVKPLTQSDMTTVDRRPEESQAAAPASRKTETGEISGAFDSLFNGEDKSSNAWGNQATTMMQAPSTGASPGAGEKEWYVAIDDAQVGPIDLAEMTQRWDGKEITEESLAWKGGMPDWVPISDIPDLHFLIKDHPQKKSGAQSSAGAAAGTTAGQAAAAKSAAAIEWKPSAASALSSLVQEELIAAKTPKEETKRPEGLPDLGSGYGTNDLFGGKVGGSAAPEGGGFGGSSDANWSVPAPRPSGGSSGEGGLKAVHIFGALGVVVVLGILGVLAMVVMKQNQAPTQVAMTPQPPQQPQTAPPAHPGTTGTPPPSTPQATPPPATPSTPAAEAKHAAEEDDEDDKHGGHHKGKKKLKSGGGGGREEPERPGPAAAPPPPPPPAAAVKANLGKEDIWGVVRQNASRVGPCLKAARGRNEIPAGSYTFILNWNIRPDGGVQGSQLTGPPNVLGSSIPGCFAAVIGQWHFPASQNGAPIKNFPFGPVNVP